MSVTPLSSSEYQAIVDGTDPVSQRHRFRPVLGADGEQYADLPPEPDTIAREDWQNDLVDREDEDRTLTGELPPGYDHRCFGTDEQ